MNIKNIVFIDEEKGIMKAITSDGRIVTYKIIYIPCYDGSEESLKECEDLEKYYEVKQDDEQQRF